MATVQLQSVVKRYGGAPVVDTVSLSVRDGEFLTLLGPSGCGKTTCLRMIAGFVTPDAGSVHIGGEDVTRVPAYRRDTGMVFQQYALFPHLTVAQNLAFGLRVRKLRANEIKARVAEALERVRLGDYAGRYPEQLSGGQKQRVALARALVINPRVLLLDEPLGALDQQLREELQAEIKRIQREVGITTIFVTHDQAEAVSLSDRIVVMRAGGISQIGSPQTLYDRPANRYVASFIGKINLLEVRASGAVAPGASGAGLVPVSTPDGLRHWDAAFDHARAPSAGEPLLLALRPERIQLAANLPNRIEGRVELATYAGDGWYLDVATGGDTRLLVKTSGRAAPSAGEHVTLGWHGEDAVLLRDEVAA
ncbi:ABC transporter ATP-binding protein [Paraburkholderia sp. BCC1886]|uniref:ABC transporter ATP-binding protein n=1 Tax=Paraburkholderia sp. BCC1886 TaxID=2562670 RepID=UPI0011828C21|nr:ABC transporter ATP-binding protein [Paraburkholderia sp. BCC1886]